MFLPGCAPSYRHPSALDGLAYLTRYSTQGGAFSYPGKASTVPALTLVCCRVCAGGCQSQTRALGFLLCLNVAVHFTCLLQHNIHVRGLQFCLYRVCFAHTTVLRYDQVTTLFAARHGFTLKSTYRVVRNSVTKVTLQLLAAKQRPRLVQDVCFFSFQASIRD